MNSPANTEIEDGVKARRRALIRENRALGVSSILASITPPAFIAMLNGFDVLVGVLLLVIPPAAGAIGVIVMFPSLRAAPYQVRLFATIFGVVGLWGSQLAFALGVYSVAPYPRINAPALYAIWGGSAVVGTLFGALVGHILPRWILSDFEHACRGIVCSDCGYSLAGLKGSVCPECGVEIRQAPAFNPERPKN